MKIIAGKITDVPLNGTIPPAYNGDPVPALLPEEVKEDYEERPAIVEYDGDPDPEEAERQAWCRTACMLSFASQWKDCERFKPKPCLKLIGATDRAMVKTKSLTPQATAKKKAI